METYKSPFTIHVIWHPAFKEGKRFAENIYSTFCRDVNEPISRGIGIPTFFRFENVNGKAIPLNIELKEADRNAIVVLIDEAMFNDAEWCNYLKQLNEKTNKKNRLYPISFTQYSYYLDENGLSANQFIVVHDILDVDKEIQYEARWNIIRSRLLHDFSRQMLNMFSVFEAFEDISTPPPIKLFISHAKKDGLKLASDFRDYITSSTKLKTFFDANDIADGYEFEMQIKNNIIEDNTALVVFHSDEYSDREWCRIEIITAKRYKAPIVVVYNIEHGEKRSFPYMGNVPTIKWNNNQDAIIDLALVQVLNNLFSKQKLSKYLELYGVRSSYYCIEITTPPELFNFIDIEKKKKETKKSVLVIYPDPPLGLEELNLLNEFKNEIEFITPILLPNVYKK